MFLSTELIERQTCTSTENIRTFHYPGYVIRLQKERPIEAKRKSNIARKQSPSQLNIKLFTKNTEKSFDCSFFKKQQDHPLL